MDWRSLNPYEVLAVVFSLVCVLLTIKENIWQWLIGIIGVIFYLVVFYQAKLYANMWLQVVFIVLQLYGWYEWLHGGKEKGELAISRSSLPMNCLLFGLAMLGTASMAWGFSRFSDNPMPLADSGVTVLSLIAQWMLAKKLLENWLVWMVVNLIMIGLGISQQLLLTAGLYAVFLILAILGFWQWRKSYRNLRPA
jgi:nicotinamide mononucleotide transporter